MVYLNIYVIDIIGPALFWDRQKHLNIMEQEDL